MTRTGWLVLGCLLASCMSVHDITLGADERTVSAPDSGRPIRPDDDDREDSAVAPVAPVAHADAGDTMATTPDAAPPDAGPQASVPDAAGRDAALTDASADAGPSDAGNTSDAGRPIGGDNDDLQDAGPAHGDDLRRQ